MFSFQGKRVVVTGGSRGIGAAIAKEFAGRQARVAILGRDDQRAKAAVQAIGGDTASWAMDVSDPGAVHDTFGAIIEAWGGVDVLVNNAGITRDALLLKMDVPVWDEVLAINLRGTYLCSRAVLRSMLKQRSGRIINITSVVGLTGNAGQANYAASKAGIIGFTKSMAREVASRSITVSAIAPGLVETDMTSALPEKGREQLLAGIPLGRLGTGEEIAAAALFLASDAAGYITGEVLRVDG
ncbi:MAG: 3-oxoacyl-[acyl-carrier-protein] reductase, partial [Planctomycetota bacterium]